jgi:ATP-dependent protease ClpP protease subunit
MIRLDGAITRGDHSAFEAALRRVRDVATATINGVPFITVELNSPGGDVVEALDIGRKIYQNFLMTLVRPGHECVSACVFVLMAGAVHTPADGSSIGLHRPLLVSWSHIDYREARRRYDGLMDYLRQYFRQLGVADSAFDLMMRTDSYGMRYFSPAEMDQLGLRGEDPAWEKFYGAKWAVATEPKPEARPAPLADAGRVAQAGPPKLAPVDQTLHGIVFMPGAYHAGQDYMAGADVPRLKPEWAPLDNGWQPLWSAVDLRGLARTLLAWAASRLAQIWWLVAILALELLRARPWPGDPRPRRERREQWRLAGLVSPASARATGQS